MGYNIYYEGTIGLNKQLDEDTCNIILGLSETRRIQWDTAKLERDGIALQKDIGQWGEFFFITSEEEKELENKYVIDYNCPPPGQPNLWGVWTVTDDRMGLIWNKYEKSYSGHEWLEYLVKEILVPRGYEANGIINWFNEGDLKNNRWHTIIERNSIEKYEGYCENQEEPDIDTWWNEKNKQYEEYFKTLKSQNIIHHQK